MGIRIASGGPSPLPRVRADRMTGNLCYPLCRLLGAGLLGVGCVLRAARRERYADSLEVLRHVKEHVEWEPWLIDHGAGVSRGAFPSFVP